MMRGKRYGRKYGNRKVAYGGRTFDSALEGKRWLILRDAERRGLISELRCQVPFELLPDEWEDREVQLKTKVKTERRRVFQGVRYVADFVYLNAATGMYVVEDTKGVETPEFRIKMKMMHSLKGIDIRLVRKATEAV